MNKLIELEAAYYSRKEVQEKDNLVGSVLSKNNCVNIPVTIAVDSFESIVIYTEFDSEGYLKSYPDYTTLKLKSGNTYIIAEDYFTLCEKFSRIMTECEPKTNEKD